MRKENLIPADQFCASHKIEISFITSVLETGLIETRTINETVYIHKSQLPELEKIVRLFHELDINLEGIETINHLLNRINKMQNEIIILRNRLRLYEDI
jgi:chaperone modulatory protein CbpM